MSIYTLEADSADCHWMLKNKHPFLSICLVGHRSLSTHFHSLFGLVDRTRLLSPLLLVCLPGDTACRPGLNRSLLLETTSSARCLGFGCIFPQCFHGDTILQSGLVCGMEKDPVRTKVSIHCSKNILTRLWD